MKSKIGVIFVHGFTGGNSTWRNSKEQRFADLLSADQYLSENYDFFEFDYYTKLTDIFNSAPIQKILAVLGLSRGRVKQNKPISKLSKLLASHIRLHLDEYEEIVIIAHSMGGLIAKDYLINREPDDGPKPIGFVSVAVPHRGSTGAYALGILNVNAAEMQPLAEYASSLNDQWTERKDDLPQSIYLIAHHDEVVSEVSALPFKIPRKHVITCPEDHTSICKPESDSASSFKAIARFLKEISYSKTMKSLASTPYAGQTGDYEKEIFVIKLILADIHKMAIEDAKESFFSAEVISKAANQRDKDLLSSLSTLVLSLYRQTYASLDGKVTPNDILAKVHETIINQNSAALAVGVDYINFLHKKGLLHQLANRLDERVIWTEFNKEKIMEAIN